MDIHSLVVSSSGVAEEKSQMHEFCANPPLEYGSERRQRLATGERLGWLWGKSFSPDLAGRKPSY